MADETKYYYNGNEYVFDSEKGWAKGSNQKVPENQTITYEGSSYTFTPPVHDMVSLKESEIKKALERTISSGKILSESEIKSIFGSTNSDNKYAYYLALIDSNLEVFVDAGVIKEGMSIPSTKYTEGKNPTYTSTTTGGTSTSEPEELNDSTTNVDGEQEWDENINESYKSYLESLGISPEDYSGSTAEEKLAYQEAWANTEGYVIKDGKAYKKEDLADTQVRDPYGNLLEPDDYVEDTPRGLAYNSYWNDLMSGGPATLGKQIQDNLATAEQNAALSNLALADAQYQQAAMQQAETVKAITDQVRAERMSRLRAGMNEAQIANQDMQMMLNNMNTLNQQANAMNANRLAAQQQYNLAQDTAYQQYLQQATNLGNIAAAMAAADAGDAYQQTLKRMYETGESYTTASKKVTGQ